MPRFWYNLESNGVFTDTFIPGFNSVPGALSAIASGSQSVLLQNSSNNAFYGLPWNFYQDEQGNQLGTDQASTVTALQAILDGPNAVVTYPKSSPPSSGSLLMWDDSVGAVMDSGIQMLGDQIMVPQNVTFQQRVAALGPQVEQTQIGGFGLLRNIVTDQQFFLIDARFSRTSGSRRASQFFFNAGEEAALTDIYTVTPPDDGQVASDGFQFDWAPNFDGIAWQLQFNGIDALDNLRIRLDDTTDGPAGEPVWYYPDELSFLTEENGTNHAPGLVTLDLEDTSGPIFVTTTRQYRFTLETDGGDIRVAPSTNLPEFRISRQLGERVSYQPNADRYLGTIGDATADFQSWPAGNIGDYLIASTAVTVNGVALAVGTRYRCNADTAAAMPANWIALPIAGAGLSGLTRKTIPVSIGADNIGNSVLSTGQVGSTREIGVFVDGPSVEAELTVQGDMSSNISADPTLPGLPAPSTLFTAPDDACQFTVYGVRVIIGDGLSGGQIQGLRIGIEPASTGQNGNAAMALAGWPTLADYRAGNGQDFTAANVAQEEEFEFDAPIALEPGEEYRVFVDTDERFAIRGMSRGGIFAELLIARADASNRQQLNPNTFSNVQSNAIPLVRSGTAETSLLRQSGSQITTDVTGIFSVQSDQSANQIVDATANFATFNYTLTADRIVSGIGVLVRARAGMNTASFSVRSVNFVNNAVNPATTTPVTIREPGTRTFTVGDTAGDEEFFYVAIDETAVANGDTLQIAVTGDDGVFFGTASPFPGEIASPTLNLQETIRSPIVDASRRIASGTGLTGGGDLSADRSLNVDFASSAEAAAATSTAKVISPARAQDFIDAAGRMQSLGVIAQTAAAGVNHTSFPAANRGDTLFAAESNPGAVNGVTLEAGAIYICQTNNTPANTPADWMRMPIVLRPGGSGLITSATASNSSEIIFNLPSGYSRFRVVMDGVQPGTNNSNLRMEVGNGTSFQTTGYVRAAETLEAETDSRASATDVGQTAYQISTAFVRSAQSACGEVEIYQARVASQSTTFMSRFSHFSGQRYRYTAGSGRVSATADNTRIRFAMNNGNIFTGNFYLYGDLA